MNLLRHTNLLLCVLALLIFFLNIPLVSHFSALFTADGPDLPVPTRLVYDTHGYWPLISLACLAIVTTIKQPKFARMIAIGCLILALASLYISAWALYLPMSSMCCDISAM